MKTEQTEQTELKKWRLLVVGEVIQAGDEEFTCDEDGMNWDAVDPEYFPEPYGRDHYPIRRRMTPAEEHAEESLVTLKELIHDIEALVRGSEGVAGLHKNGDIAPWDDLLDGGRYEGWLPLTKAEAAIAKAEGGQP